MLDISIYLDLKHLSASGLNATESSRGRRMNKTQTLSWRKYGSVERHAYKQWQYNVKNDVTKVWL